MNFGGLIGKTTNDKDYGRDIAKINHDIELIKQRAKLKSQGSLMNFEKKTDDTN